MSILARGVPGTHRQRCGATRWDRSAQHCAGPPDAPAHHSDHSDHRHLETGEFADSPDHTQPFTALDERLPDITHHNHRPDATPSLRAVHPPPPPPPSPCSPIITQRLSTAPVLDKHASQVLTGHGRTRRRLCSRAAARPIRRQVDAFLARTGSRAQLQVQILCQSMGLHDGCVATVQGQEPSSRMGKRVQYRVRSMDDA